MRFIEKVKNHQSIKLIKDSFLNNRTFSFDEITISDIEKNLEKSNSSKSAQESDIPTEIIKNEIEDFFAPILHQKFNKSI